MTATRAQMVDRQIAARGISDPRILDAFRTVPREAFVAEHLRGSAYADGPLPIEAEQTISQPYMVAVMMEAAALKPGDRVLEVGAGSGYAAALIGQIAAKVVAIERLPELAALAATRLAKLGYGNIEVVEGDGSRGCPGEAPFDAIIVSASGPEIPRELLMQLRKPEAGAPGGILVMPVGGADSVQRLLKNTRSSHDVFDEQDLGPVRFVPLIGAHAWPEEM